VVWEGFKAALKAKDDELKRRPQVVTEVWQVVLGHQLLHEDSNHRHACGRLVYLPSPVVFDAFYNHVNAAQLFERSIMIKGPGDMGWQDNRADTSGNMSAEPSECGSDNFPHEGWEDYNAEQEPVDEEELAERVAAVEIMHA
jgi:hypothetical protein